MPALTLYSIDGSPPCRSVFMVLEIIGLEAEIKEINPLAGEQFKPEFVEKNHLHTIPLLEEQDFVLADSHAIITYIVSKYGAEFRSTLYPADVRVRATIDQRLYFDTGSLFTKFRLAMEDIKNGAEEVSDDVKANFEEAYGFVEKYLEASSFLATDHVTLADIAIVATVSTMDALVPVDAKYEKLHAWWNRLKEYDWYKNGNEPGLIRFSTIIKAILKK